MGIPHSDCSMCAQHGRVVVVVPPEELALNCRRTGDRKKGKEGRNSGKCNTEVPFLS